MRDSVPSPREMLWIMSVLHSGNSRNSKKFWSYSVEVITFGFDPDNPGSNPGRTSFFAQRHLPWLANQLIYVFPVRSLKQLSFFFFIVRSVDGFHSSWNTHCYSLFPWSFLACVSPFDLIEKQNALRSSANYKAKDWNRDRKKQTYSLKYTYTAQWLKIPGV